MGKDLTYIEDIVYSQDVKPGDDKIAVNCNMPVLKHKGHKVLIHIVIVAQKIAKRPIKSALILFYCFLGLLFLKIILQKKKKEKPVLPKLHSDYSINVFTIQ